MDSQEIGGRYSVVERIGKGAMGVVFKAYDPVLDRVVAIKKMASEIGQDEELRQRFYVEARAAARLNHRNIVTIHELEEADGEIYIVMELLEGVDLASVIRRKVQLPLEAKLSIVSQLCEGLDYAHRHGIVHRDVKPGNVHLSPSGVVKILDFGIARLASSKMTGTGALLGTPDYMSPEQVMGEDIDARSDLFAVGGVLYELLASAKAFESETVASLLIKIAKNPHVPITDRVPDLPVSLVSLVNRLLAKDRDQRPPTAAAVVAELRACLLSVTGGSDTAAAAMIGGVVTEQTIAIANARSAQPGQMSGTPRPAGSGRSSAPRDLARAAPPSTQAAPPATPPPAPPESTSNARLASLALQRGRELRKSGDLAGAIQVFRSVLEVAPGSPEALDELQAIEGDIREATSRRPPSEPADPGATVLKPRPASDAAPIEPSPPRPPELPPPAASVAPAPAASTPIVAAAPTVKGKSGAGLAVAATLLLIVTAAAGGGYYLLVQKRQGAMTTQSSTTSTSSVPAQASAPADTPSTPASSSVPVTAAAETAPPSPAAADSAPPVPAPTPAAPDAKPTSAATEDAERTKADLARTRLETVKRASLGRRPPPLRMRRQFIETEREANAAYSRGDYATAATGFENAAKTMEAAVESRLGAVNAPPAAKSDASTAPPVAQPPQPPSSPRQTVESRRTDPAPARPGPPPPPNRDDEPTRLPPTRDTTPVDVSTFNRSAPSTVDQMFNAAPSARATIARIKDVIERYSKAIEQRDGETLRGLRTDLNLVEQRLVRQGKQVTYRVDDVSVQSNGQEGVATGRRTVVAEFQSGEKINLSGPVTIRLIRRQTGWVIVEIK